MPDKVEKCSPWALGIARAFPKDLMKRSKIWDFVRCGYDVLEKQEKQAKPAPEAPEGEE